MKPRIWIWPSTKLENLNDCPYLQTGIGTGLDDLVTAFSSRSQERVTVPGAAGGETG